MIEKNSKYLNDLSKLTFYISDDEWNNWVHYLDIISTLPNDNSNIHVFYHQNQVSNVNYSFCNGHIIQKNVNGEVIVVEIDNAKIDALWKSKFVKESNQFVELSLKYIRSGYFTLKKANKLENSGLCKEIIENASLEPVIIIDQDNIEKWKFDNINEVKGFRFQKLKEITISMHILCVYWEWWINYLQAIPKSAKLHIIIENDYKIIAWADSKLSDDTPNNPNWIDVLNNLTKTHRVFYLSCLSNLKPEQYDKILSIIKESHSIYKINFDVESSDILSEFIDALNCNNKIWKITLGDPRFLILTKSIYVKMTAFMDNNISREIKIKSADIMANDFNRSYEFSSLSPFIKCNFDSIWIDDY